MSGTISRGHVPQQHYLFTGVRDMHARCTDQFEALFHLSPVFASRPWRDEFERVRSWGRNLYSFGDDKRTLEDHLKEAGALGRALMQTFENIEKELVKCELIFPSLLLQMQVSARTPLDRVQESLD